MVEGHLAPNEEWGFWKNLFDRDSPGRVPVFFLRDSNGSRGSGKLRAMGLAMMFRLACDRSVRDAVENAQFQACTTKLDLADLVFGAVLKGKNSDKTGVERDVTVARRGRVSFGVMHAQGTPRAGKPVRDVVLGSPKASYYPNYVEQGQGFAELPSRDGARYRYKTFMNEDVRIRGWKRYRPQDTVRTAPAPRRGDGSTMDLSRVGTSFTPLDAGTRFRGLIRIHNLRPVELGALLWSLDFGESEDCFHTFGLARSLGYGKVRLGITTTNLSANDGSGVDLGACREAFADWMDAQLSDLPGKWRESEQIRHLVELAKSVPVTSDEARHMLLKHPQHRNEFLEAKRLGLALAPIGRPQTRAPSSAETSRPQHGAPRREVRRAGFSGISAPMPVPAGPTRTWSGIKGGTRVKAKLIGMSKRGKWQVELTDHPAQGVVGLGDAPPDLEMGGIVEVVVTGGGNPTNLVLRWP